MPKPTRGRVAAVSPPPGAIRGGADSILLTMTGLQEQPASGSVLHGLAPYFHEHGAAHAVLLAERTRMEPWGDPGHAVVYQEIVHWERKSGVYRGACWPGRGLTREELEAAFQHDALGVVDWAARRARAAVVSSAEPLRLSPCHVPKPWGREVWYTGIERRGRAKVISATGETELPYAIGMFPDDILGTGERAPVLLKALEPLPREVAGDLYLEVHEEKWEVYVVLDVDRAAWPDGVGRLRAGLDAAVVERYRSHHGATWERAVADDLSAAIRAYEPVRRRIDGLLDDALRARGIDPAGVPAGQFDQFASAVPAALQEQERLLRAAVEAFLGHVPMAPGDVACLEPGVLHSLQHGVKVIEFQTPTYERLIAMFAQKVLTQPHWDSERAIARMAKAVYRRPAPEPVREGAGLTVERIVNFPGFQVFRHRLAPESAWAADITGDRAYSLVIGIGGEGEIALSGGRAFELAKEAAYLLPAALGGYTVRAGADAGLSWLTTAPHAPADPAGARPA